MPLYDRTYIVADNLGTNPSTAQAQPLAMWIREQNGQLCVVDGTGCTLSADFITAVVKGVNWRPTPPYATKWNSHVKWTGITQSNRRTMELLSREFPRKL